ncbi:hypothetical protein G7K_4737-t1 [Saitoella complicata NRRL Y-17804]|uniref:Major facilitator superfamily (MFS) profile domain-containing protein n=2 Tax=Saitoella complicata (strain BCRC 22490 / CBS 7301 / JCM 7358 / NBRC 10748 / NRRL Y-17804) TaxID=698492 RepID=A0A0E9NLD6_SAICN|nr:hypothetical protein G7K_4737-t1 [Saitoella complicata NRRL Y-17804]
MGIINAQYGSITACTTVLASVMTIFSGLFTDTMGQTIAGIVFTSFSALAAILSAVAIRQESYGVLIAANVISAFGGTPGVLLQESIVSLWFVKGNIMFAMAISLISVKLAAFITTVMMNPFADWTGSYGDNYWLARGFCGLSLAFAIGYAILLQKAKQTEVFAFRKLEWRHAIPWSIGNVLVVSSVALLVPMEGVFTALSLQKIANDAGQSVLDIIAGIIQDHTPDQGYQCALLFWILLGGVGAIVGVLLGISDIFTSEKILTLNDKSRKERIYRHDL